MPACGLGHDARGLKVQAVVQGRADDALRHADQCCEVNDDVGADLPNEIDEIGFLCHIELLQDKCFVLQCLSQVLSPTGSEIVDAPDGVASSKQLIDRVTADESGGAGDDDLLRHR